MPSSVVLQLGNPLLRQKAARVEDPTATEIHGLVPRSRRHPLLLALQRPATDAGSPRRSSAFCSASSSSSSRESSPGRSSILKSSQRSGEKIIVWDACLSFPLDLYAGRAPPTSHCSLSESRRRNSGNSQAGDDRNLSELLQHEIDHLDGILAIDRVSDIKTICTPRRIRKTLPRRQPLAVAPATINN